MPLTRSTRLPIDEPRWQDDSYLLAEYGKALLFGQGSSYTFLSTTGDRLHQVLGFLNY